MQRFTMMTRVIGVALGVVIALVALASASAQQEPPFRYYGDGTDGDMVTAHDAMGEELGSSTVSGGSWYIDVDRDEAAGATFTINGEATTAELSAQTTDSARVALTIVEVMEEPADCPDDSMMEGDDDSMMEDDDSMMEGDDDAMMSDDCPDDSMMDDDDSMMDDDDSMLDEDDSMMDGEDVGYPGTGTGGLAGTSGISAGLIGLLIALGAAAIAGLGLRRVRNRA